MILRKNASFFCARIKTFEAVCDIIIVDFLSVFLNEM